MEKHFLTHKNKREESLGRSIKALKNLEDQPSSYSMCEHSLNRVPLGLALEDLEQPSLCEQQGNMVNTRNKVAAPSGGQSLRRMREQTFPSKAVSFRNAEEENKHLRSKVNSLHEQNASLASKNQSLADKLEVAQSKQMKSNSHVRFFETSLGTFKSRIAELEEQIVTLEAKAEADERALRKAEDGLLQNQNILAEKESILHKFREELKNVKVQLYESSKQCKRAEKQRNAALLNAEELTRAFQQYKANIAEKLEKVKSEEETLNKNFSNCEKQRKTLQERCMTLEQELESTKAHLRILQSENNSGKESQACAVTNNAELIALLTQSNQRVLRLEAELENKARVLNENNGLLQENKALKERLAQQSRPLEVKDSQLQDCGLDPVPCLQINSKRLVEEIPDSSYAGDKNLIADLRAQISLKEAENQELQARLLGDEGYAGFQALDAEPVKLISRHTDDSDLQLETLCKQLQTEKERLTLQLKDLQDKLGKVQAEATSAKQSMAQRTGQFQVIQQELMEKASKTTSLQQELSKKSLKIAALQKLLEEKSMTCSTAAARNAELEHELMSYKEQIFRLEENIRKEHEEVLTSFERSKQIYAEQQKELQNKIENLQCQLNMKSLHITEQDHTIQVLQHDTESKQQQIESLDHILTETRRELDLHTKNACDTMRMLENQVEDETDKVRHLESALALCKEELVLYLQQLEENRHSFSNQIKKKSEELQCLRVEIKHRTQSLQETNEENVRLQQTLQQQQQMLQQGTTRIGELEDTQAELQQQVCQLELQIEKQRFTLEEQLRKSEEKLLTASQELELKREQVLELNNTIIQIQADWHRSEEKLMQMKEENASLRCQEGSQSNKLNEMEMILQKTQAELDKKSAHLAVCEEKLNTAEKHMKKKDELELELQNVKKQLQKDVKHIQDLEETLTKTHLSLEEKESIAQRLTEELRTCKQELEDRDHEILDMNEALKDRNWELKQRATQLNQLDMSIREHKEEMEQKITRLESDLEKARLEKENLLKQISCLDEKNQETSNVLCEKDFELLDKEQSINQLKMAIEKNRLTIQTMEKMVKTQELCISGQQQDSLDLSQEVRLARERMQVTHLELVETRQKLSEAHKESERLNQMLEAMDQLSREKVQHRQQDLEEAQDTICNLKTELDARNEVIKATNDVLILKESEITRLKARISGYNRIFSVKTQNTSILHSGSLNEFNSLESHKYDEALEEYKSQKLCRSLSASDSSLVDLSSLDLPKSILEDIKNIATSGLTNTDGAIHHMSSNTTTDDSSFNPLEYTGDMCEMSSDCTELGTLSGMLKYIQKEMKEIPVSPALSPTKNVWLGDRSQGKQV